MNNTFEKNDKFNRNLNINTDKNTYNSEEKNCLNLISTFMNNLILYFPELDKNISKVEDSIDTKLKITLNFIIDKFKEQQNLINVYKDNEQKIKKESDIIIKQLKENNKKLQKENALYLNKLKQHKRENKKKFNSLKEEKEKKISDPQNEIIQLNSNNNDWNNENKELDQNNSLLKINNESSEPNINYFPLSTIPLDRHDPNLWKTIKEMGDSIVYDKKYYDALVESANNLASPSLRFTALVEIGNLSVINGNCTAFQKAQNYLKEIISNLDPNIALTGLKKIMMTYCFIEEDKYIPDYMEVWNNRGSVEILLRLAPGIKGGDKSLRNETANICRSLLKELKELLK